MPAVTDEIILPLFGSVEHGIWDTSDDDCYKIGNKDVTDDLERLRFSPAAKAAVLEKVQWCKKTDDGEIFADVYDDRCGSDFDYNRYKADITKHYMEEFLKALTQAHPKIGALFDGVKAGTFEVNVAVCNVTLMDFVATFDPVAVSYAFSVLQYSHPEVWERFQVRMRQKFTGRDGYIPYYTNDSDAWVDLVLNLPLWYGDDEKAKDDRFGCKQGRRRDVDPIHALGVLLECIAFREEWRYPEDPTKDEFSDIHPLYYAVTEGGNDEYYKYGGNSIPDVFDLFRDAFEFRLFEDKGKDNLSWWLVTTGDEPIADELLAEFGFDRALMKEIHQWVPPTEPEPETTSDEAQPAP